jgi:hypothetical protein
MAELIVLAARTESGVSKPVTAMTFFRCIIRRGAPSRKSGFLDVGQ